MLNDLSGSRFGYLKVLRKSHYHGGHIYWLCSCDCGKDTVVRTGHLKSGHTNSCGCKKGNRTHCESKTRLYVIWNNMRDRCENVNNPQFHRYGGRGITVHPEWNDYITFRKWAYENGYADHLTIDRIDNNLGYYPWNCRWTTPHEQANNTRKTRLVTYNGETHSVSEWARILNIKQSTLSMRLNKYGWSAEKALGKEVRKHGS